MNILNSGGQPHREQSPWAGGSIERAQRDLQEVITITSKYANVGV